MDKQCFRVILDFAEKVQHIPDEMSFKSDPFLKRIRVAADPAQQHYKKSHFAIVRLGQADYWRPG